MIEYTVDDGICTLRLATPPLNVLSLDLLAALGEAMERAAHDATVRAIVITGSETIFSSGADIDLFRRPMTADAAAELSATFQQCFQQVEDSPKPVLAAVAGQAIGGALELAIACHWRLVAESARLQMPEVNLGIVPGAGGTQRLPRLAGAQTALDMLLSGKPLRTGEALAAGLLDEICPAGELLARATARAAEITKPSPTSRRTDKIADPAENESALAEARSRVERLPPELAAPRLIVDAVRAGLEESFAAGIDRERAAFAQSVTTPAAQNKIHLFFASRGTSRLPEIADVETPRVESAAVIGTGTMGTGIALALLQAGMPVTAIDQRQEALDRARQRIESSLRRRAEQGKATPEQVESILAGLHCSQHWEDLGGADLVIESVFEDPDIKRGVLSNIDKYCRASAILATNTSTLTLDALSADLQRPERLVGMHFFNPAQRMPLLEVVRRDETPPEVLAGVLAVAKRLRKTPVVAQSREGFIVVRIFVPYVQEAFRLLEEGAEPAAIDQTMVDFGFPMGPLVLIDMTGLDILAETHRVLQRAFPWHGPASPVAEELVRQGHLGQKTGSGVYRYVEGDRRPQPNPALEEIVAAARQKHDRSARSVPSEEIAQRLQMRMFAEGLCVMAEGVARSAEDVDVATVLGIGFPDFRGGVMTHIEQLGRQSVQAQLRELGRTHGERFAPEVAFQ